MTTTSTNPNPSTTKPWLDPTLPVAVLVIRIKQWLESYVATEDRMGLDDALELLRKNLVGTRPLPVEVHVVALKITYPMADWLHRRKAYWETARRAATEVYGAVKASYWLDHLE